MFRVNFILKVLNDSKLYLKIILRKLSKRFSDANIEVLNFSYSNINKKGLLIISYETRGLVYLEIFNKKYFKEKDILILNLSQISNLNELKIAFRGVNHSITKEIVLNNNIITNYDSFKTSFQLNQIKAECIRLTKSNNEFQYSLKINKPLINLPNIKLR